jgi:hypothetical protein
MPNQCFLYKILALVYSIFLYLHPETNHFIVSKRPRGATE